MEILIGYLVTGILFGLLTNYLAKNKGYDSGFWWGFFLGVIGLIVVGFRRDISQQQQSVNPTSNGYLNRIMTENAEKRLSDQWICLHCSAKNPPSLNYCFNCRRGKEENVKWTCSCGAINKMTNTKCWVCERAKGAPLDVTPLISSEPAPKAINWTCPNCTRINSEEAKFCMSCGTMRQNSDNIGWKCPACEYMNREQGRFCINCGAKKDGLRVLGYEK